MCESGGWNDCELGVVGCGGRRECVCERVCVSGGWDECD